MIDRLAPREREIAGIVYGQGEATAAEVCAAVADPLTNSAVRSMLRRLEAKGLLRRRKEGKKFIYAPAISQRESAEAMLRRVSLEHFDGSLADAALALIDMLEAQQPGAARAFEPKLRYLYSRRRRSDRAGNPRQRGRAA